MADAFKTNDRFGFGQILSPQRNAAPAFVVAADFLRARRWMGNAIAAASRHSSTSDPYDIREEILEELLKYERCAAWLVAGLTANGSIRSIPPSSTQIIRRAAMKETQSTMRARVDARDLSAIAARLDIPIVVLKGGVRAVADASPALPIADIDILVPAKSVELVVRELTRSGFGTPRPALSHHQGMEPANGHLSVEVHWSLLSDGHSVDPAIWNRIESIAAVNGLFSLGRVDNLVHVVRHALENHRQRPASLRDTILAGTIADTCSVQELAEARRQLQSQANSPEALQIISFGEHLVGRDTETVSDPFVEKCAAFYATVAMGPRLPRIVASIGALSFVSDVAIGRVGFFRAARDSLKWQGTAVEPLSRFGEKFPRVVRPLVGLAHLAYYSVAAAVAIPFVRRAKNNALKELDRRNP